MKRFFKSESGPLVFSLSCREGLGLVQHWGQAQLCHRSPSRCTEKWGLGPAVVSVGTQTAFRSSFANGAASLQSLHCDRGLQSHRRSRRAPQMRNSHAAALVDECRAASRSACAANIIDNFVHREKQSISAAAAMARCKRTSDSSYAAQVFERRTRAAVSRAFPRFDQRWRSTPPSLPIQARATGAPPSLHEGSCLA